MTEIDYKKELEELKKRVEELEKNNWPNRYPYIPFYPVYPYQPTPYPWPQIWYQTTTH